MSGDAVVRQVEVDTDGVVHLRGVADAFPGRPRPFLLTAARGRRRDPAGQGRGWVGADGGFEAVIRLPDEPVRARYRFTIDGDTPLRFARGLELSSARGVRARAPFLGGLQYVARPEEEPRVRGIRFEPTGEVVVTLRCRSLQRVWLTQTSAPRQVEADVIASAAGWEARFLEPALVSLPPGRHRLHAAWDGGSGPVSTLEGQGRARVYPGHPLVRDGRAVGLLQVLRAKGGGVVFELLPAEVPHA